MTPIDKLAEELKKLIPLCQMSESFRKEIASFILARESQMLDDLAKEIVSRMGRGSGSYTEYSIFTRNLDNAIKSALTKFKGE